jgi:hypothetical protein
VHAGLNRETDHAFLAARCVRILLEEVLCRGAVNLLRDGSKRQHGWPDQALEDRAQGNRAVSLYGFQHLNRFHHWGVPIQTQLQDGMGPQIRMLMGQQLSLKRELRGG